MTMFSMKPKFDLAEFLAEPARAGSRAKVRQYRRPTAPKKPDDEQKEVEAEE